MTVWIWARNDIKFSMAAGLIRLHMPASSNLVCNEGLPMSPYSPRQSLALFMEDSTNYCCQKQHHNFHLSSQIRCKCFIVVGLLLPYLNTPILKAWGSASRAQRPLTTGIVRRQFSSLRGITWHNNGRSAWNGSRFEHICTFYVEITNIHGVKMTMSCYNRD